MRAATAASEAPPLAPQLEPRLEAAPEGASDVEDGATADARGDAVAQAGAVPVLASPAPAATGTGLGAGAQPTVSPSVPTSGAPAVDPPARAGRLNYYTDGVSMRAAGLTTFGAPQLNRPVVHGDSFWTGERGRLEMHLGSHVVRLGPRTAVTVTTFDDAQTQLSVAQGTVSVRVRELHRDEIAELDLPNAAMTLTATGRYRVDVDPAASHAQCTVQAAGHAEVLAAGRAFALESAHTATIEGSGGASHQIGAARAPDAFDSWGLGRDRSEDHPEALRYVSRSMVGYEDLDRHGSWSQAGEYGAVWYPTTVAAGWAPYRYGRWAWIDPWGWTWVDDAPWGFAPFHYGRWAYIGSRWGWAPGPIWTRPCYAPALVGFVGPSAFATGVGMGFGVGVGVGWFALGWREPYIPAYRASYGYVHAVNVTQVNVTQINQIHPNYVNQGVPGSITAVHASVLQSGAPVQSAQLPIPASAQHAQVAGSSPQVTPTAQSVMGRSSAAAASSPAPSVMNRATVTRATPAPAVPPFASRQAALSQNGGRPLPAASAALPAAAHSAAVAPTMRGSPAHMPAQAYHAPQIVRTQASNAGPHPDPHPSYSRPTSSGAYSVPATYRAPTTYTPPQGYRAPSGYAPAAQRYEPAAGHHLFMPSRLGGGGHFRGRR